jgi:hypothetical protein
VAQLALHRGVRAGEREARVVVIKCGIFPASGVVALVTRLWKTGLHVIRIGRPLEIRQMATDARGVGRGQVVVVVHVAQLALHGGVRAGEREARRGVVKRGVVPGCCGMALLAGGGETRLHVVGIRRPLEIRQVATDARRVGSGQIVVVVHMAQLALHRSVRAGKREARRRVVKRGAGPRGSSVALLAGGGKSRLHVIGIRGPLEIRQVTTDARRVGAGQIVVAVHVALPAQNRGVRAGKREARRRMVKCGAGPVDCSVALLAGRGETGLHVVGICRPLEILQVAADAIRAGQIVIIVHMAKGTLHRNMRTGQGEVRQVVVEGNGSPV